MNVTTAIVLATISIILALVAAAAHILISFAAQITPPDRQLADVKVWPSSRPASYTSGLPSIVTILTSAFDKEMIFSFPWITM